MVRDLLVTIGGRWVQMLIALAGNVITARALGPDDFGRFGLVMAVVTICGTLADAGLTYSAVRFIAQYQAADPPRAHAVARAYMALRLGSGAVVALAGMIGAAPLAGGLLGYPDLTPYLQLAFGTLFSLSISSYPGTVLVALGQFGRLGVAGVINAVITVAGSPRCSWPGGWTWARSSPGTSSCRWLAPCPPGGYCRQTGGPGASGRWGSGGALCANCSALAAG